MNHLSDTGGLHGDHDSSRGLLGCHVM